MTILGGACESVCKLKEECPEEGPVSVGSVLVHAFAHLIGDEGEDKPM